MRLPRHFVAGFGAAIGMAGLVAAAVAAFMVLGGYDTSATSGHPEIVARLLHQTMRNSVSRRAGEVVAPKVLSIEQVRAGAAIYREHCLGCHGGPGIARSDAASGLLPTPPYLLDASDEWAELYVIVRDGVKMTAMPAWRTSLADKSLWDVVAFLEAAPALRPAEFKRLLSAPPQRGEAGGQLLR